MRSILLIMGAYKLYNTTDDPSNAVCKSLTRLSIIRTTTYEAHTFIVINTRIRFDRVFRIRFRIFTRHLLRAHRCRSLIPLLCYNVACIQRWALEKSLNFLQLDLATSSLIFYKHYYGTTRLSQAFLTTDYGSRTRFRIVFNVPSST